MGEVYRASDPKLKREVAIKVLPAAFTSDPERLARFEREAQLLAQLHHPNVASVFGLEESDGVRALIMELVEGEDLTAHLARGPIPLAEALPIALQIAHALEAAHAQGIVHRDLKPANVKVRADGTVKVLDFGLAKAMDPVRSSPGTSPTFQHSPTLTADNTQLGTILGTAAYMAPEQARGGVVDKRADIWAFGVVLFEMLSGRPLFAAETVSDTLAGVLKTEIDFAQHEASAPPAIRRLLRRCLERNPKNRLHDIADARIVLEEVVRGVPDEGTPALAAPAPAPVRRRATLASVAVLALLLGLVAGWLLRRPAGAGAGAGARWALAIPDGLALSPEQFPQLALSADGRLQVVVVVDSTSTSTSHLLLRSSDTLEPRILPDTDGANAPFLSPDATWIGFTRNQALYKIPVGGGPPVELAPAVSTAMRGATWGRDGFVYFAANVNAGLSRVSENGGAVSALTQLDAARDERTHRWPQVLPDGSAVLFTCDTAASTEFYDDARIEAVRLSNGERKVLVEGASQAHYASGDRLVFARGGALFAIAFDPRSLTVHGAPELITQSVATDVGSGAVQFALSESGAALWAPGGLTAKYELFWVDRSGKETPASIPPAPYNEAELSPDGKRVALVGGEGGVADLWVADLERGARIRLTTGQSIFNPVWTPDGARIAYTIRPKGGNARHWQMAWIPADGSREAELLLESESSLFPSAFTPDGRLLYAESKPDGAGSDVFLLPVGGARVPQLLLGGPFTKRDAVVSPDGRWLAYVSNESGPQSVFVRPFPAGEGRWQISIPFGVEPRFGRDQREIFYRAGSELYRVAIDTRGGFSAGRPEMLVDRVSTAGTVHTYAPAPDGRIFTPRSPAGRGSARTVYIDLGFASRLAALARPGGGQP